MKTICSTAASLLLSVLFTLTGCIEEAQPVITKDYDLKDFTKINLGDAFRIDIKKGSEFKVRAEGEQDDIADLELKVENGTLTGRYRPGSKSHDRVRLRIELPVLIFAHLHSATRSSLTGFNDAEQDLEIEVSGSSALSANLDCKRLLIKVSGASEVILTGGAERLIADVSGKSLLKASNFPVEVCNVDVSGVSQSTVFARLALQGTVNGNSKVRYFGNPTSIDVAVASDSELIKQ